MGSIYQIRNKTCGKLYVGQTQDTKTRDGVPYRYGISGRWSDHVSSAFKSAKTPLAEAICAYGAEDFEVTCLEKDVEERNLDEREAHWIAELHTTVPDGYNVMKHSRCKHRQDTTIAEHYIATTTKVRLNTVKRNGTPRIVHVYLDQEGKDPVRFVFGQGKDSTFDLAKEQAQAFVVPFAERGVEIFVEESEDPLRKYREKIEQFWNVSVKQIRIAPFNNLIALHVKTSDTTTRICFGGKTVSKEKAYEIAHAVKDEIITRHPDVIVQDDVSRSATGGCS